MLFCFVYVMYVCMYVLILIVIGKEIRGWKQISTPMTVHISVILTSMLLDSNFDLAAAVSD